MYPLVVSGAKAFELLSPEEQEFALSTVVQYAPWPYQWIGECKATSDGLAIASVGAERDLNDLTPWRAEQVQRHPVSLSILIFVQPRRKAFLIHVQMAWRNPGRPNLPHLQIMGPCVHALHTTDRATGQITSITDLATVRSICHGLQRKVLSAEYIYAHAWREGDLVLFHNQGVWHSITGQLDGQKRLMWQCTMASGAAPEGARG